MAQNTKRSVYLSTIICLSPLNKPLRKAESDTFQIKFQKSALYDVTGSNDAAPTLVYWLHSQAGVCFDLLLTSWTQKCGCWKAKLTPSESAVGFKYRAKLAEWGRNCFSKTAKKKKKNHMASKRMEKKVRLFRVKRKGLSFYKQSRTFLAQFHCKQRWLTSGLLNPSVCMFVVKVVYLYRSAVVFTTTHTSQGAQAHTVPRGAEGKI